MRLRPFPCATLVTAAVLCILARGGTEASCSGAPCLARPAALAPLAPADDRLLTDEARVLAGIQPETVGRYSSVTGNAAWQAYADEFDRTWAQAEGGRHRTMRAWRDAELLTAAPGPCDTLLYPFSGPDIVNAWVLLPDCNRYVMFGLEHTGSLPQLEKLNQARLDRLLVNVRHVVADLFERNYFITKQMLSDLETPELEGTVPVIALLLARLGCRVSAVTPLELTSAGMLAAPGPGQPSARSSVAAVRVDVISPAGRPQQILYIRAQADDAVLVKQPALTLYLKTLRPYRTLIKSASYLMHGDGFSRIRGELLAGSTSILQDDTGIPFSFLNTAGWNVRLYGEYTKPIKALGYSLQTDLAAAFAAPGRARPLPFTWGYHWRDGMSHLMLAVRR
jgi:hypothetical protein